MTTSRTVGDIKATPFCYVITELFPLTNKPRKCRICEATVSHTRSFKQMDTGLRFLERGGGGPRDEVIITYEDFVDKFRESMTDYPIVSNTDGQGIGVREKKYQQAQQRTQRPQLYNRIMYKDPLTLLYLRNYMVMCLRHYQCAKVDTMINTSPFDVSLWLDLSMSLTNCAQRLQITTFLKKMPIGGRVNHNEVAGLMYSADNHMYHRVVHADKNMFRAHPISVPLGNILSYYMHRFLHFITPHPNHPYVFHLPDTFVDPRGNDAVESGVDLEHSAALRAFQVSYTSQVQQFIRDKMGLDERMYPFGKHSKVGNGPYHFLRSIFLNSVGTQCDFNRRKLDYMGCFSRNQVNTIQKHYINSELVTAYAISDNPHNLYTTLIDIAPYPLLPPPGMSLKQPISQNTQTLREYPDRLPVLDTKFKLNIGVLGNGKMKRPPFSRAPKNSLYELEYLDIYFLHGLSFEEFMDGCYTLLYIHNNRAKKISGQVHYIWNEYTKGAVPKDENSMYLTHKLCILCALMQATCPITVDLKLFHSSNTITRPTTKAKLGRILKYIKTVVEAKGGSALSVYTLKQRSAHYKHLRGLYTRLFGDRDSFATSATSFVVSLLRYTDEKRLKSYSIPQQPTPGEHKTQSTQPTRKHHRIHIGIDASPNCIALAIHNTKDNNTFGKVFMRRKTDSKRAPNNNKDQILKFESSTFKAQMNVNYRPKNSDLISICTQYLRSQFLNENGTEIKKRAKIIIQQESDIPGSNKTLTEQLEFNQKLANAIKVTFANIARSHFDHTRLAPNLVRLFYCNFRLPTDLRHEDQSNHLYTTVLSHHPNSKKTMCNHFTTEYTCVQPSTGWPFTQTKSKSPWIFYDDHPLSDIIDALQLCFHSVAQSQFKADSNVSTITEQTMNTYYAYASLYHQQSTCVVSVSNLQFILDGEHQTQSTNFRNRDTWTQSSFGEHVLDVYGVSYLDRRDGRLVQSLHTSNTYPQYPLSTFRQHIISIAAFRKYLQSQHCTKFETWSRMISNRAQFVINSDWVQAVINTPRSERFYSVLNHIFDTELTMGTDNPKSLPYMLALYVVVQLRNVYSMTSHQAFAHAMIVGPNKTNKQRIENLDKLLLHRISIRRHSDGVSVSIRHAQQTEKVIQPNTFILDLLDKCIETVKTPRTNHRSRVRRRKDKTSRWYTLEEFISNKQGSRYMYKYWAKFLMIYGVDAAWWNMSESTPNSLTGMHIKRFFKLCHLGSASREISKNLRDRPDGWATHIKRLLDSYRIQAEEGVNHNQIMLHLTRYQEALYLLKHDVAKEHFKELGHHPSLQAQSNFISQHQPKISTNRWDMLCRLIEHSMVFMDRYNKKAVHPEPI